MGLTRLVRVLCRSQGGRVLLLVGSFLATAAVVMPCAYAVGRVAGLLSAAAALATCLGSGLVALWLIHLGRGGGSVTAPVLLGMGARMGIPLLVCVLVYLRPGQLAEAGFVYYLLVFYFVTLVTETILLVSDAPPQATRKRMV